MIVVKKDAKVHKIIMKQLGAALQISIRVIGILEFDVLLIMNTNGQYGFGRTSSPQSPSGQT